MNIYPTPARLFQEIFAKLLVIDESFNLASDEDMSPVVQRWLSAMDKAYKELWMACVGDELYALKRLKSREREHRLRFEELISLGVAGSKTIANNEERNEITDALAAVQQLNRKLSESLKTVDPVVMLIDYHFIWTDQHYGSTAEPARALLRRCVEEPTQGVFAEYVEWANDHLATTEATLRRGLSYPNDLFKLRKALSELEVYLLVNEVK